MHRSAAIPGSTAPDAWARAISALSTPVRRRRAIVTSCGYTALIATYLLIGVIGHDPWKQDEPYVFGIVLELMRGGDWVIPMLAGEPFMEKPPLYYLLAAACAGLATPLLAMHDAARLASAVCTGVTLVSAARAARLVWGRSASMATCLLLAGCLGLVLPARQMLTDLALLAGFAVAFLGLVEAGRDGRHAAAWLGTGVGIAFLAKGLIGPGTVTLAALLLLADADFRRAAYIRILAKAAVFTLPWMLVWPAVLYARAPDLFIDWFWENNIGRFAGFSVPHLGAAHAKGFWWYTIPWFTFPALPIAVLALRRTLTPLQRRFRSIAIATTGAFFGVLIAAASARETYALPLLLPLSVLAAGALRLRGERLDRVLASISAIGWGLVTLWLVAIWATRAHPGEIPGSLHVARLIPAIDPLPQSAVIWWAATSALVVVGTAALLFGRPAGIPRWLVIWVAGIDLALCALLVLGLPWLDQAKSYRTVFESIAQSVPERPPCMVSIGLGESERAMLDYVALLKTHRLEIGPPTDCPWLMVQGLDWKPEGKYAAGWKLVWSGGRPGDGNELFRIYHRRSIAPRASGAEQSPQI